MKNVFFRYVFGLYPLGLVLLPIVYPCGNKTTTSIIMDYRNLIGSPISEVHEIISRKINQTCLENHTHTCEQNKEIGSIHQMVCSIQRRRLHFTEFQPQLTILLKTIQKSLGCDCELGRSAVHKRDTTQNPRRRKQIQKRLCKLKNLIANIQSCFQKFHSKEVT
ncbi:interleukin-7-like [Huso huso]|uniref:Interleukin-7 n=1 Tax=Huso huso TaxID=61971 RepID=A0ABR1A1S2_HUSHU